MDEAYEAMIARVVEKLAKKYTMISPDFLELMARQMMREMMEGEREQET